jgi:PAS domain S-box-containing protein
MKSRFDQRFFPLIFNTISHGIFTVSGEGVITSFNHAAERITGFNENEVLGRPCSEVLRADICETDCPLHRSIDTRERTEDHEVTIVNREGKRVPIAISTAALVDHRGHVIGGVEMFRDISVVNELKKRLYGFYGLEDIRTKSRSMKAVLDMLPLVSNSQSNVLILGESGTGKELVARAIHNLGVRSKHPFVAVNCAAVPETLLESELFGYKKGAFTDATKDKPGRFAAASKGTLFLDEIAELSLGMQAKLLRVLEHKQYERLGDTQPIKADVRIIAATNRDLADEVRRRTFRQDLYFRLNVVSIHLPPLRERREDIPLLTQHFIDRFNAVQGRRISRCSERVMTVFMRHPFPGNVRELENAIEHAFVICAGSTIELTDLPLHLVSADARGQAEDMETAGPLVQAEEKTIRAVLDRTGGNRKAAAEELGISRTTLWRKMRRSSIMKIH